LPGRGNSFAVRVVAAPAESSALQSQQGRYAEPPRKVTVAFTPTTESSNKRPCRRCPNLDAAGDQPGSMENRQLPRSVNAQALVVKPNGWCGAKRREPCASGGPFRADGSVAALPARNGTKAPLTRHRDRPATGNGDGGKRSPAGIREQYKEAPALTARFGESGPALGKDCGTRLRQCVKYGALAPHQHKG